MNSLRINGPIDSDIFGVHNHKFNVKVDNCVFIMLADADESPICHSVPVAEHINDGKMSSLQSTSVNYI